MIRLLLVNEIRLICNVIAATLEDEADIQVVGTATTVERALELAPQADIVLVGTNLPDGGALRLTQAIREAEFSVEVLVLGLAESKAEILQYVEAGAAGYVLKDDSVEILLRNIRSVYNGKTRVSPEIAAALMARVTELSQLFNEAAAVPEAVELTPREQEVLQLIERDLSNQEIAEQLVIEVGTVKNHVHSILQKLNVSSRQDAAAYWAIVENKGS